MICALHHKTRARHRYTVLRPHADLEIGRGTGREGNCVQQHRQQKRCRCHQLRSAHDQDISKPNPCERIRPPENVHKNKREKDMKLRTDESARQKEGGQTSREAECEYGARERDRQTDRDRDRDRQTGSSSSSTSSSASAHGHGGVFDSSCPTT